MVRPIDAKDRAAVKRLHKQGKSRNDGFVEIEDRFAAYEVYDPIGQKIGKVDDLFVNEADEPEYIGVTRRACWASNPRSFLGRLPRCAKLRAA